MPCCIIILLFSLWEADPVVLNASLPMRILRVPKSCANSKVLEFQGPMCTCRGLFGYGSKSQLASQEGTAMHVAVHEGHTDVVKLLLGFKPRSSRPKLPWRAQSNSRCCTSPWRCSGLRSWRCCSPRALSQCAADPSVWGGDFTWKMDPEEFAGARMTPLHLATMLGHTDLVRLLLEAGADRSAMCNGALSSTVVPTAELSWVSLNTLDKMYTDLIVDLLIKDSTVFEVKIVCIVDGQSTHYNSIVTHGT